MQGEVPGLTITRTSTRPGSEGAEMKIRGDISVNGKSSPLVIIDGITGSLDELNAMDASDIRKYFSFEGCFGCDIRCPFGFRCCTGNNKA